MLIIPNRPSQFWFHVLQDLLMIEVFIISLNADVLYLSNQLYLKTPYL